MKLNKKGFTLVELLVTIVIVGLVIGFSVFGIISLIKNSKDKVSIISENNLKEAARIYSSEASNDSWKKENDFDAFCVTINELMNKGLLDKNATIQDGISKNTYIIVKRNKVTLSVIKEEITKTNDDNYKICSNTSVNKNEIITNPVIGSSVSYTDKIVVNFTPGSAKYNGSNSEVSYKCLYGESGSNLNREGSVVGNSCVLEGLRNNRDYYIAIYMNTNNGSSVLAEGNNNYKTSEFNNPTTNQNKNIITINYNDVDTNGNNINNPKHYFKSTISGISNIEVKTCTLKNGEFTCNNKTTVVKENTWYQVENTNVTITYPEDNNKIKINTRIYDGSNNYKENEKDFTINKYTVKFYKNTAKNIGGSTNTYIEKSCISGGTSSCSITSPTITANTGYNAVGWNNNKTATVSNWNANTTKQINSNLEYYAITKVNTYTVKYNANCSTTASGTTANSTHTYGAAKALTANGYKCTGYTFNGWNTASNGSGTSYADKASVINLTTTNGTTITLYAIWKEDAEVINATKFTCEDTNRLAVLHVTTCTGNNCIYDTKNGLDSSYDFSTDQTTPNGPTWKIDKSNYVDSVKDKTSITTNGNTCKRVVRYVNNTNGLNCRTSVDTSKDNVKKKFSDCAAINVYRSTWKSSGGYNYYYSSTYGCFVSVGYLSTTKPSRCTTSSTPTMAEKCADACGDLNSCWNGELSKCYCCASENTPCNLIGGVQSCHTVTIS